MSPVYRSEKLKLNYGSDIDLHLKTDK